MTTLFVSDLHLAAERPALTDLFLRFLQERAAGAAALYILGDLFEAWLGDDLVLPEYTPVLSAMRDCVAAGTALYVQHGNRDFLLGAGFEAASGARLLPEPATVDLPTGRALLLHGDSLCTDDLPYQQLRAQLRSRAFMDDFLAKPPAERIAFARGLRERSRTETAAKSDYTMDVNAQAVTSALREAQSSLLIHGHTHRPGHHLLELDGRKAERWVLGDWGESGSVLVCDEAGCRLEAFG